MDCAEEVSLLRRNLSEQTGIYDLTFDVLRARMNVEFDPLRVTEAHIQSLVERTGMRAEPWQDLPPAQSRSFLQRHTRLLAAALSGAFILVAMVLHGVESGDMLASFLPRHEGALEASARVIMLYGVAIVAGFYWALPKAWVSLRYLRPDMNVLVAVSILGAGGLGEWSEAATLAFLFSLAAVLETWSISLARNAVSTLLGVTPAEATVLHHDHEHRTAVDKVDIGSLIRVKPGERIPCDGSVMSGSSTVDQALITGESVPVWKEHGSKVYAGTINGHGVLEIRTTRAASNTTLARIVRMVQGEGSSKRRAPSEQFVEKFARYYTPAVLLLAMLVATIPPLLGAGPWGHWLYQGMVVLLISCPCALVISTPVTIVSALASAAGKGVLIKGGAFLEEAARLKAMAFDKTGVLTQGEPEVEHFIPLNGRTREEILPLLAGLEMGSEHPLGRAIFRYSQQHSTPVPVAAFEAVQGLGAQAAFGTELFWAGGNRFLREKHLQTPELQTRLSEFADSAHTAVLCGTGQEVWAMIGLKDSIRADAPAAMHAIRTEGINTLVMLTGDSSATAAAVAAELKLDDVRAELFPEEKAAVIEELRKTHGSVAMIGDGINDAPAMAAASIGIALGQRATDVALETANIVLMSGDLNQLPFLLRHARRTSTVIRQNVAIALGLKAIFLLTAVIGAATLWMAVAADMGATLLVTFNALRLLRAKEAKALPAASN